MADPSSNDTVANVTQKHDTTEDAAKNAAGINEGAPTSADKESEQTNTNENETKKPFVRFRRKMVAILLGYCGSKYSGMQRNPGVYTVEEALLEALLKANGVSQEVFSNPTASKFQRTARTDKGVHAARQVVSLQIHVDVPDMVERLNNYLPDDVRVFRIIRVARSFNCKMQCTARRYEYLTPTYALAPKGTITEENAVDYRLPAESMELLRKVLKHFEGTHNFHNYTTKMSFANEKGDPGVALRYIKEMSCTDPFLQDGLEFVRIIIRGQSFVYNQIRNMVGMVMAVVAGYTTETAIPYSYSNNKVVVPRAPGLGLLLDDVFFENYNQKYAKDKDHEILRWDSQQDEIQAYKERMIYNKIIAEEKQDKTILKWLEKMESIDWSGIPETFTLPESNRTLKKRKFEQQADLPNNKNKLKKNKFQRQEGPCWQFLKGTCNREQCRFSHDQQATPTETSNDTDVPEKKVPDESTPTSCGEQNDNKEKSQEPLQTVAD
eukprot:m.41902 g.41902  ORF g.41902 m.41902 type:complete len:494 (-) comp9822_c0_seq1:1317-2798(-)